MAKEKSKSQVRVGIVMGSDSDFETMKGAAEALKRMGVKFEMSVISAHRTPEEMFQYARSARSRGLQVIIAGAGGAAHLPGMVASLTELPVIGVPVPVGHLQGQDALLSIVQMPKGVPVATVAIGNSFNAGLLASQIVGFGGSQVDGQVCDEIRLYKAQLQAEVKKKKLPNV